MAHKGKLWPIRQDGRLWVGQFPWPKYPGRRYELEVTFWDGAPVGMPTNHILLKEHSFTRGGDGIEWRSDPIIASGQTVEIIQWVWADTTFFAPNFQYQILLNGAPQYAQEVWNGYDNSDWRFLGADFVFPLPTIIGTMSIGLGSASISRVVGWPP